MIRINPNLAIDDREVKQRFVRASGPGGQNLRKEATAVELTFDIRASSLAADVKDRLMVMAGRRVTKRGVLVVMSRAFRSLAHNRAAAQARFVALLQRAAKPRTPRRLTRPDAGVGETRLASKRLRSATKSLRSAPRVVVED